eukprot:7732646-Lingulodinium_polyedra.AAC.1
MPRPTCSDFSRAVRRALPIREATVTAQPSTVAGLATPRSVPSFGTPPLEPPPALPGAVRAD